MAPQILITGASRGIGLALATEFAGRGWRVRAACRTPDSAEALKALAAQNNAVSLHPIDVTDQASIDALAAELQGETLDVLCNNAGIGGGRAALGALDFPHWRTVLETNLLGAVKTTEAFLPHVEASTQKKIVSISSSLGSISTTKGGSYAYRSSKAALNMAMRSIAMDLQPRGVTVAVLSPGIVDTDFTRGARMDKISPQESARGLADMIEKLSPDQTGEFLRYNGEALTW
ncbi:MAG: SDR family oxidoreductase [Hyphomonadaceae bacterium]